MHGTCDVPGWTQARQQRGRKQPWGQGRSPGARRRRRRRAVAALVEHVRCSGAARARLNGAVAACPATTKQIQKKRSKNRSTGRKCEQIQAPAEGLRVVVNGDVNLHFHKV